MLEINLLAEAVILDVWISLEIKRYKQDQKLFLCNRSRTNRRIEFDTANIKIDLEEIKDIFEKLVDRKTNEIPWSSFLYACIEKSLVTKSSLVPLYKYLNTDFEKEISYESLRKTFMRRGHNFKTES